MTNLLLWIMGAFLYSLAGRFAVDFMLKKGYIPTTNETAYWKLVAIFPIYVLWVLSGTAKLKLENLYNKYVKSKLKPS